MDILLKKASTSWIVLLYFRLFFIYSRTVFLLCDTNRLQGLSPLNFYGICDAQYCSNNEFGGVDMLIYIYLYKINYKRRFITKVNNHS